MADLQIQKKADLSFNIVLLLYFILAANLVAETWIFNPPPGSLLIITILQLIPLMVPLLWVLKRSIRAVAWLCFILCFYFISGVLDAWFRPEQFYGWLTVIDTVLLFSVAILFIRWEAKTYRS